MLIALDHLDEVIALIRASANPDEARVGLLEKFGNFVSKTMALVSETLSDTSVNVIIPGALVFGLLLFAGGKLLAGLEYPQSHGRITEVVYEAATAVTLLTLFGNIVLNISSEASTIYLGGAVAVGIIMIIIMIITKIITSFFRK